jgi:hypothetical protein
LPGVVPTIVADDDVRAMLRRCDFAEADIETIFSDALISLPPFMRICNTAAHMRKKEEERRLKEQQATEQQATERQATEQQASTAVESTATAESTSTAESTASITNAGVLAFAELYPDVHVSYDTAEAYERRACAAERIYREKRLEDVAARVALQQQIAELVERSANARLEGSKQDELIKRMLEEQGGADKATARAKFLERSARARKTSA